MSWIRLDIDYDRCDWLRREKRMVKDAWPNLLRFVKKEAPKKATIRFRNVDDLAYAMRYDDDEAWAVARLIEVAQSGDEPAIQISNGWLTITKWAEFQSPDAERVRNKRETEPEPEPVTEESCLSVTNDVCPLESDDVTELDDSLRNGSHARDTVTLQQEDKSSLSRADRERKWETLYSVFPKRAGGNGKATARLKFLALIASGSDPDLVISGAERYRISMEEAGNIGTPYVKQISTWLNQRGYLDDYLPTLPRGIPNLNGSHKAEELTSEQLEEARLAVHGA